MDEGDDCNNSSVEMVNDDDGHPAIGQRTGDVVATAACQDGVVFRDDVGHDGRRLDFQR